MALLAFNLNKINSINMNSVYTISISVASKKVKKWIFFFFGSEIQIIRIQMKQNYEKMKPAISPAIFLSLSSALPREKRCINNWSWIPEREFPFVNLNNVGKTAGTRLSADEWGEGKQIFFIFYLWYYRTNLQSRFRSTVGYPQNSNDP